MISKDLLIKDIGEKFISMVSASEEKAKIMVDELANHRKEIEDKRKEQEEILKQLALIDMMKSELLMKLNGNNKELREKKESLVKEEKELRQQQVHKIYPDMFIRGIYDRDKEIDNINSVNYRESL